jgi:hypothetical protein
MMGLMETSTASMGEILEVGGMRMAHLAPAPAPLASVVQTVLPALKAIADHLLMIALLIHVKPLQPPQTMGLMVTSTASMGGTLAGLLAPAPALLATLGLVGVAVKAVWSI